MCVKGRGGLGGGRDRRRKNEASYETRRVRCKKVFAFKKPHHVGKKDKNKIGFVSLMEITN